MADLELRAVVSAHRDGNIIVDYQEDDFRDYWDSRCKSLLHECECEIIKRLLPPCDAWFVDIGCGYGRLTPTYLDSKKRIVAVDYSTKHLEMACDTYPQDNMYFVAADAYHLPFRDGVFASGLCIRLFHHIASPEAFLCELSRVFMNEASVVFNYMNKRNLMRVLRYGPSSCERGHREISRVLYATHPKYFARLAKHSGFKTIAQEGTGLIHQIAHRCRVVERLVEAAPCLIPLLAMAEKMGRVTLGRLRLALMQYVLLHKVSDGSGLSCAAPQPQDLMDVLLCPGCRSTELYEDERGIGCTQCGTSYPKQGGIYDFRLATML